MRRTHRALSSPRSLFVLLGLAIAILLPRPDYAQSPTNERTFTQPKLTVEKAMKQLQPSASGRLPVLDGFTSPGDRPLERFHRGFYQCAIQMSSLPSGGTVVRISAKITAWYDDSDLTKSGYQVLPSNGRLESDLLDRLQDALGGQASSPPAAPATPPPSQSKSKAAAPVPAVSAAMPGSGIPSGTPAAKPFATPANSPFSRGNGVPPDLTTSSATQKAVADKHMEDLTKEAKGLEEILHNQAHPANLAAVKTSGTPVLVGPVEGAKVLFLATAEDEFEILDMNVSWVHVRISGLSRGWIRRSALEVPEMFASDAKAEAPPAPANAEPFQVKNEEIASFPGSWKPLQGRTVKILTVQKTGTNPSATGSQAKLEFMKSLFQKEYAELTNAPTTAAGVVVIFDSEDGGLAAATLPTLQQWKTGAISEQSFWRRCFFDPPETFIPENSQ